MSGSRAADAALPRRGQMEQLVGSHDWAPTPLGPLENWPRSLRTAMGICLQSRFPMVIWWGPRLVLIYNDAWHPLIGAKHPWALGRPGREVFPEIWDVIGPMFERVMASGDATWSVDELLLLDRNPDLEEAEEAYFTWSYSPIPDESGGIGGVFTAVTETTDRVLNERRGGTTRDLTAHSLQVRQVEEAYRVVGETLSANPHDVPFALLYAIAGERTSARLVAMAGIAAGTPASPAVVAIGAGEAVGPWPLGQVAHSREALVASHKDQPWDGVRASVWGAAPSRALTVPVFLAGQQSPELLLVVGLNPHRALDDEYRNFLDLVGKQVGATLTNARAHETERTRAEAARQARLQAEELAAEQIRLRDELQQQMAMHVQLNAELRRVSEAGDALRRQAEERSAMLEQLDRLKDDLLATASHDLKSPLTSIKGYTQLLLRSLDVSPPNLQQLRQGLSVINTQTAQMARMLDRLLDAARIQAGAFQARLAPCDLRDCLETVLRELNPDEHARVDIDLRATSLAGNWEQNMIEQLLANLLGNALKYSPTKQRVRLEAELRGGEVAVAIGDRGVGIPTAELAGLFERFHRTPQAHASGLPGTGLGLFICRGIVEAHSGRIWAESPGEGQGTTFRFTLPQEPAAADAGDQ